MGKLIHIPLWELNGTGICEHNSWKYISTNNVSTRLYRVIGTPIPLIVSTWRQTFKAQATLGTKKFFRYSHVLWILETLFLNYTDRRCRSPQLSAEVSCWTIQLGSRPREPLCQKQVQRAPGCRATQTFHAEVPALNEARECLRTGTGNKRKMRYRIILYLFYFSYISQQSLCSWNPIHVFSTTNHRKLQLCLNYYGSSAVIDHGRLGIRCYKNEVFSCWKYCFTDRHIKFNGQDVHPSSIWR